MALAFTDIPNINVLSYSYNVIVTSNITIACNVSATPDVTSIKWQKGSTNETTDMVIDHVKYSGGTVDIPSLTIWHLGNEDEGWYTCTAENLVGIGTSNQIYINVTGGKFFIANFNSLYTKQSPKVADKYYLNKFN